MSSHILECVPNFSEGRDKQKILTIARVIANVSGISVLDIHSDPDHNRSVITFTGEPQAVFKAAFEMTKKAKELINLRFHQGIHPRIGATDVIPFIPLLNYSDLEAINLAYELAQKINATLGIPTFLYEKSALKPEHKNLADIRKGNFENLQATPDFGSLPLNNAGATVIGVRDFLVAYNINLQSNNLEAAKEIAKAIRATNGGLPGVKALGLQLNSRGICQISMNLTNFRQTNIDQAFDKVQEEAARRGIAILESELIGLIPKQAYDGMRHREILLPYQLETRILQTARAIL